MDKNIVGIQNIGNTCYMNSMLQLFLNYNVIIKFFLVNNFYDSNLTSIKMFLESYYSNKPEPNYIKTLLGTKNKQFVGNKQCDSHESLITLLDIINDSLKNEDIIRAKSSKFEKPINIGTTNISIKKLLDAILSFTITSTIKCPNCNHISETKLNDYILSLSIENCNSLIDCLNEFQKEEQLNENNKWKCDKCNNLVLGIKKITVTKYPKYITFHLKRFNNNIQKNSKNIDIPLNIILDNKNYELKSYVLHSGSTGGGHYINYTKNDNIYLCNDSSISISNFDNRNQGYIFLYTKS